jgi:TetR/AcrR family transcriptional repressor of nem operon
LSIIFVLVWAQTSPTIKTVRNTVAYRSTESDFFANGGCPVLNTAVEAVHTNEPLRKRAAEALVTWKNSLAALIKQGITTGEFKADTDINKVALSIVALIEGAVLIGTTTQNPDYIDLVLDTIYDLVGKIES